MEENVKRNIYNWIYVTESLCCTLGHAKSLQSCPTLHNPVDYSLPGSSVHGILQARILEWVAISSSRGSSWPRTEPVSVTTPALAGGFLPTRPTWESESDSVMSDSLWPHGLNSTQNSLGQNTGVGSLSLLQGIFSTQGLNWNLLHCRQILYQLSCEERLANPMDRGAWKTMVHRVTKSWTQLKWLSTHAHAL